MDIKSDYPVVIVGGGMAGASVAIALAQIGIKCGVFEAFAKDAQQQPSFDDRTVALSASSLNIFRSLSLSEKIAAVSEPIHNIHVSEQGNIGFSRIAAHDVNEKQLGAVIENWQLGKLLQQQISQLPTIDYFAPVTVETIEQNQQQARLVIRAEERLHTVTAALVVLADGARSPLRQQLHIDSEITDYQQYAIVCNVATQKGHDNWAFERFTAEGPLALLPMKKEKGHNRLSIVWSKDKAQIDEFINMPEAQFAQELERTFGARLGKITQVGKRQSFPLIQHKASSLFRGRCVLIANAAQSLHPIAGQGFNLGLRDIATLIELLQQADANHEDLGSYQLLRNYQQRRESDRERTLLVTESLARFFANDWFLLSIARNLLIKTMDITPFAKRLFAQGAMGFHYDNNRWCSREEE